jgi:hypothetical protein
MLEHFRVLLWLRFTILRHTFTGGKALSFALMILVALFAFILAAGIGVGLFVLAINLESKAVSTVLLISDVCVLVFLFFWSFALLMELQRSEVIDFRKMLFLPVSLRMVFLLNYGVALFTPALLLFALPALGIIIGLTVSFGPRLLAAFPLAIMFYLMIGAWTYYVRGALAAIMENKRRRRLVVVGLTLAFVLAGQLPNLIQSMVRSDSRIAKSLEHAASKTIERTSRDGGGVEVNLSATGRIVHAAIPLAWLPYGIFAVVERRFIAAAGCFGGMGLLTALGLALGFRSTRRYYMGVNVKAPPVKTVTSRSAKPPLTARTLPIVDDDTSAMTMACFLSYLRLPSVYMMLIMPFVMGFVFLLMFMRQGSMPQGSAAPEWMLAAVTVWPFLNIGILIFNVFGTDGAGFRALILLPTERRKYFLAKHLALFPMAAGMSILFVVLASLILHMGALTLSIAFLQVVETYLLFCTAGNFMSVFFPYRISWEGMRGQGRMSQANLMGFLIIPLTGILLLPSLLCFYLDRVLAALGYASALPMGLPASIAMVGTTAIIYKFSLRRAGTLLLRREQRVLDRLVRDRE